MRNLHEIRYNAASNGGHLRAFLISSLLGFSLIGGAKTGSVQAEIDKALAPLRTKGGVELSLKRKSVNSMLAREKLGEGRLYYRKGLLRLVMKSPEESLLVVDGKTIWLESKLDKEMGGKTIVSKTSAGSLRKSKTLIAALLENRNLTKEFKLKKRKSEEGQVRFDFEPKDTADSEIQSLTVWLTKGGKGLSKVMYTDDKENEVTLEFGSPKALDDDADKLFRYSPPKGADVTEF